MFKACARFWTGVVVAAAGVALTCPIAASDLSTSPNSATPLRQSDPPPDSRPAPPKAGDGIYVAVNSGSTCTFKTNGPIRLDLKIARYVGETDADGRLKDPAGLVAAGVIEPEATLEMPVWDIDSYHQPGATFRPEVNSLSINGRRRGILIGGDSRWELNKFTVPLQNLRFPVQPGGAPGNNEIVIHIDTANGAPHWCTAIEWVALRLKSMAPVVLVHGNNSNPGFFDRQGCTAGLRQAKVPYVLGPKLETAPTRGVGGNGEVLAAAFSAVASQQASSGIHILAHSKGGLDARWAIDLLNAKRIRLSTYSLSTLSTPHLGTVLANLRDEMAKLADLNVAVELVGFRIFAQLVAETIAPDAGLPSLTTTSAALLAEQTRQTAFTPAVYVAADADRNGNRKIDTDSNNVEFLDLANENRQLMDILQNDAGRAATVIDILYQSLGNTSGIDVVYSSKETALGTAVVGRIFAIRTSEWRPNDTLVPMFSGLAQGPQPWPAEIRLAYASAEGRNHSNVASAEVCRAVAQEIISIDRRIGGMR
jgi:hypothetical protein